MIEFTAECGHTVRAKDDAAGDTVRCSYCGKQVEVPAGETRGLDYLFRDVDQPPEEPKKRKRKRKKAARRSGAGGEAARGVDLVSIIMRLCYGAVLLIVVIFVVDRYVMPQFRDAADSPATVEAADGNAPNATPSRRERRRSGGRERDPGPEDKTPPKRSMGLMTRTSVVGLYVNSTPQSAVAYCIEESRAPADGAIFDQKGSTKVQANGASFRVADGTYVVDVMVPLNDPNLNDSSLPYFSQYREFRRAIEFASDRQRAELLEDYFVADGAVEVFIEQTPDQTYVVRRFVGVRVREGRSGGVRSLFLPNVGGESGGAIAIQPLVQRYLPKTELYGFSRTHVESELDYYEVPLSDREAVMKALTTVGIAPYVTADGRTRLFAIGINDGAFSARVIRNDEE